MSQSLFGELQGRLDALEPRGASGFRKDWGVFALIVVGALLTLPNEFGWWSAYSSWLALVGVCLELVGLVLLTYRQAKEIVPELVGAKQKYACELDSYFIEHERLRDWLRGFAAVERNRRVNYLESRRQSLERRFGLVFGAVDKLGVLPVIAAVFLQTKSLGELSLMEWLLGAGLVFLYLMALWMSQFRLQLELYIRLLKSLENEQTGEIEHR